MLTFGPDGMTGHDDHKAACRWATAAFDQVGRPGAVLAYATKTPDWNARYVASLDEQNVFMGFTPPATPVEELVIHEELAGDLLDAKVRALMSMPSQVMPLIDAVGTGHLPRGDGAGGVPRALSGSRPARSRAGRPAAAGFRPRSDLRSPT